MPIPGKRLPPRSDRPKGGKGAHRANPSCGACGGTGTRSVPIRKQDAWGNWKVAGYQQVRCYH